MEGVCHSEVSFRLSLPSSFLCGAQVSTASTGFGGQQFWGLLRNSSMELEARHLFLEARSVLPKRGGLPLQVCPAAVHKGILGESVE